MLRQFLSILFVCLVTLGVFVHDADAGRFGGGRSFGFSRSASSFTRAAPSPAFGQGYSRSQPFGQTSNASRWLGPLGGMIAGGLLASLFMGHGFGSGLMSWLLVAGVLYLLINAFKRKMQPISQDRHHQQSNYHNNFAREAAAQFMRNSGRANVAPSNSYPVGFDADTFLREAKVQFIRMQASYDEKNVSDIRRFTTPEVFAEIQMQLQERGEAENRTNVMKLEAELLDVLPSTQLIAGTNMQTMVASVRFSGLIQEHRNEAAAVFDEIWHFNKEVGSQQWLVSGVQQN